MERVTKRFRVMHAYGTALEWERMEDLAVEFGEVISALSVELTNFNHFIDRLCEELS